MKAPKRAEKVNPKVGVDRHHAAYNGMVGAPIVEGYPSKTSTPKAPEPIVGAGKGFRGI
jgi:hypothetical protein